MKCANCGKIIQKDNARHCSGCGNDYCEDCADKLNFCSCFENLGYYN